ncbi:MAG: lipopolysaccharide kinase InaA family protein [Planctomycetes bacterium]|nr:lipopolysaccharide kinase InaA family protein [Planctomycetota bacterium]
MVRQHEQSAVSSRRSLTRVAYFEADLPNDLADQMWRDPVSLVNAGETLQRTGLRHTVRVTWGSREYVIKHYQPSWWHAVKQLTSRSRASATCTATQKLADAGISTPRPTACIENRWGMLRRDSFLIYPYVEGRTLRSYFSREAKESRTTAECLWRQLRELWQQLEQQKASLADTNTGNFIVSPAGVLWVIDLDKARFHRMPTAAARYQERGWRQLLRSAAKC